MEASPMENHCFEEKDEGEEDEDCPSSAVALRKPCAEAR